MTKHQKPKKKKKSLEKYLWVCFVLAIWAILLSYKCGYIDCESSWESLYLSPSSKLQECLGRGDRKFSEPVGIEDTKETRRSRHIRTYMPWTHRDWGNIHSTAQFYTSYDSHRERENRHSPQP